MPDSDRNSLDGAGAMDEERRRLIEEDLLRSKPQLRYNAPHLREMVNAILRGSEAGWPSQALPNTGQLPGKENMDGFFSNMEDFRKKKMGNKNIFPETTDPEDERYFGERTGNENPDPGLEPGQQRAPGIKSLEEKQGSPVGAAERGQNQWLRSFPAAGRFGARRTR